MKKSIRFAAMTAFLSLALAPFVSAQNLGNMPALATLQSLATLSALPEPADDPLLDSSGNVMLDAFGNPMSDPKEGFHQVKPSEFDPAHSNLVQAAWLHGIGCPTSQSVQEFDALGNLVTTTFADTACPTGDPNDQRNHGLLLAKTGPTNNNAAAVAELKKVRGITLTELGYDIRKSGVSAGPLGSHCGAGAPRFDVITSDGVDHFLACNSPPPSTQTPSATGWIRLRWNAAGLAAAFPPILPTDVVRRIVIVFDEGQDASGGPDQFGAAILDNIDVNGTLVGRGATDAD